MAVRRHRVISFEKQATKLGARVSLVKCFVHGNRVTNRYEKGYIL